MGIKSERALDAPEVSGKNLLRENVQKEAYISKEAANYYFGRLKRKNARRVSYAQITRLQEFSEFADSRGKIVREVNRCAFEVV